MAEGVLSPPEQGGLCGGAASPTEGRSSVRGFLTALGETGSRVTHLGRGSSAERGFALGAGEVSRSWRW